MYDNSREERVEGGGSVALLSTEEGRERPPEINLKVGVHDLSRVEWTVSVDLPQEGERDYEVHFSLEVPASAYSIHDPWEHLQNYTRLQSPTEEGRLQIDRGDFDELRRDALGVAHRLKTHRHRFERACEGAATQLVEALHPSLEGTLLSSIDQMTGLVGEMRALLCTPTSHGGKSVLTPDLGRECELADEFLSHQLLDALAQAEQAVDQTLLGPNSRLHELDTSFTDRVHEKLSLALEQEIAYRREHHFLMPEADRPEELSRFLERNSRLKKHFQDVLFLDIESFMVDYRVRNYTGTLAACIAAAFWVAFTLTPIKPGAKAGLSVGTFAVIFAFAYALKDRVKEMSRLWLTGGLTRLWGQRVVKLRLPARLDKERPVVVETRESFQSTPVSVADPLNQMLGQTRRVILMRFAMRATVHASPALKKASIFSIKHISRYDISPLFARLDDAVKKVPVYDSSTRRVRFADAPKEYRLPVCIEARFDGKTSKIEATLVCSKRGIERLEYGADY
jgi:hypothetical protein